MILARDPDPGQEVEVCILLYLFFSNFDFKKECSNFQWTKTFHKAWITLYLMVVIEMKEKIKPLNIVTD